MWAHSSFTPQTTRFAHPSPIVFPLCSLSTPVRANKSFQSDSNQFRNSKQKKGNSSVATINLRNPGSKVAPAATLTKKPFAFIVADDENEHLFRARSDEEMQEWIDDIQFVCQIPFPTRITQRQRFLSRPFHSFRPSKTFQIYIPSFTCILGVRSGIRP